MFFYLVPQRSIEAHSPKIRALPSFSIKFNLINSLLRCVTQDKTRKSIVYWNFIKNYYYLSDEFPEGRLLVFLAYMPNQIHFRCFTSAEGTEGVWQINFNYTFQAIFYDDMNALHDFALSFCTWS